MAIASACLDAHIGGAHVGVVHSVHAVCVQSGKMLQAQNKRMDQPCVVHTWVVHTLVAHTQAVEHTKAVQRST
jgi:hypothetical protein